MVFIGNKMGKGRRVSGFTIVRETPVDDLQRSMKNILLDAADSLNFYFIYAYINWLKN